MNKQKSPSESLYNVFYTFFKLKYLALVIIFVTFAGIIFGTYLIDPMWKATAKVRVQLNPKQQLMMLEGITTPGALVTGVNPANDVIQFLMSRELAEGVVKKFERDKLWEKRVNEPEKTREIMRWYIKDILIGKPISFLRYLGILKEHPDNYLAMAVDEFEKDLREIELEEDTTVVNISVWGESTEVATSMTNNLVQLLLEKNLASNKAPIYGFIKTIRVQMEEAEKNLASAQENIRSFKETSGFVLNDEETSILLKRLDKFETELTSLESEKISLEIEKASEHPEMKSLVARIDKYKNKIIPEIKNSLLILSQKEAELSKLNQDLKIREDLFSMLKQRVLELEVLKNLSTGDLEIKVIDYAKVYSNAKPNWPRWIINVPLGFIGSILTGLMFIFFIEYWNTSFKSVKELEENMNIPVLGAFPKLGSFKEKAIHNIRRIVTGHNLPNILPGQKMNNSATAVEAYNRLADSILIKEQAVSGKQYLVTSPGQDEGKSTIVSGIAQSLAMRGKKVLLIEANFRNPSLKEILNVKPDKNLLDYYNGNADLSEIIKDVNGVGVIFAGNPSANHVQPFEIFNSYRIDKLLQNVGEKYDFIFFDSPCIKKFNDALSLISLSDSVILVVESNKTPKRTILMASQKINTAGKQIKGIILNKQVNYVPELIQNLITHI